RGQRTERCARQAGAKKPVLNPAETLDEFVANAAKIHDPSNRLWGAALRGFRAAGQNMYIYPAIFRELGGEWYDGNKKVTVTSEPAIKALEWYTDLLRRY